MPPKGSKKGAASKRGANLKKTQTDQPHQPAAPKKQNLGQKSTKSGKKEAAATHDANGFLVGSKEANWALLQASGRWYTELDEGDFGEAEGMGVVMGSNEWVMMKTPQRAPPVLKNTRRLSRKEWEFPEPRLRSPSPRRSGNNKRKASDEEEGDAPAKRSRRAAGTEEEGEGNTPRDSLALRSLPPSKQGLRMAFEMGMPVLDTLPPRQRKVGVISSPLATTTTATNVVEASSSSDPPPRVVSALEIVEEVEIGESEEMVDAVETSTTPEIIIPAALAVAVESTSSSALSSVGSRTPSPPPPPPAPTSSILPLAPVATTTTTTTTPGRKGREISTTPGRKGTRGSFPCTQCTKSFGRVEHLTRHVTSVHDRRKEFVCEGCGGRFSRKDNMRQHQGKCGGFLGMGGEE